MQSGISLLDDQSPPPITLPALAVADLNEALFDKKDLSNEENKISADAFDAL